MDRIKGRLGRSVFLLVICFLLISSCNVLLLAQNMITNGDFQSGNTGFVSDYYYSSDLGPEGRYSIQSRANNVHGAYTTAYDHTYGTSSGLYLVANGSPDTSDTVWRVANPISVTAGQVYRFEAYLMDVLPSSLGLPGPSLKFQLGDGSVWADLGTTPSLANEVWTFVYADGTFSNSGNYYIRLVNNQAATAGNDFAIDDIFFSIRTNAPSYPSNPGNPEPPVFDTSDMNNAPSITSKGSGASASVSLVEG